jgi:hypothetical protein
MHLTLVGKELQEELLKTAVQVPVYSADIVTEGILTVIGKFYRLTVCTHKVLTSEKTCKVSAKLQRQRFQTAEKFVV